MRYRKGGLVKRVYFSSSFHVRKKENMSPVCYYCGASLSPQPIPTCSSCNHNFTPFSFSKTYGKEACRSWLEHVFGNMMTTAQSMNQNNITDRFIMRFEKEHEPHQHYFGNDGALREKRPAHPFHSLAELRTLVNASSVPLPRGVLNHIDFIHRFTYIDENKKIVPVENLDDMVKTLYPWYKGTITHYEYKNGKFFDPAPHEPPPEPKFNKILICMDTITHIFIRPEFLPLTQKYVAKLNHIRDNYSALEYTPQYLRVCYGLDAVNKKTYMKYMKRDEMRRFCAIDMIAIMREWEREFVSFVQDKTIVYGETATKEFKHLLEAWAKLRLKFFDVQAYYGFVIPDVPRVFSDDIYYILDLDKLSPLAMSIQNYRTVKTEDDIPKLVDAMFLFNITSIVPSAVE